MQLHDGVRQRSASLSAPARLAVEVLVLASEQLVHERQGGPGLRVHTSRRQRRLHSGRVVLGDETVALQMLLSIEFRRRVVSLTYSL